MLGPVWKTITPPIKGDHLTLAFGNERNEKREGTIKIDPIKIDPKTKSLDWVILMAGDAARKAIYELKGDDLKIGFGVDGWLRPTRFEMGKDQVGWLLVLKREREEAKPAPLKEQEDAKPLPKSPDAKAKSATPAAHVKKPGAVFKAPGSHTLDVALSPDGKLLARAGTGETGGQTVDLWDVASGKKLHTRKGHTA